MHYGDPIIRKAVPLAIGLVSASNPQLPILDTLSKYSHDNDLQVAINAIFAMGLVGAGTNNARLAQMLRQLAGYYQKEPDSLFMVRIAQGLVHMGKGTIGLNPFFSDRSIMSRPAVAGLLATLTAFMDTKACRFCQYITNNINPDTSSLVVLDKHHWMLYLLTPAMYPRFLITLDENLENKPVTVRVGQVSYFLGVLYSSYTNHPTGHRRCGPSRKAQDDIWLPNSPVSCAVRDDGTRRARDGRIYPVQSCPRRICGATEKSWVGKRG